MPLPRSQAFGSLIQFTAQVISVEQILKISQLLSERRKQIEDGIGSKVVRQEYVLYENLLQQKASEQELLRQVICQKRTTFLSTPPVEASINGEEEEESAPVSSVVSAPIELKPEVQEGFLTSAVQRSKRNEKRNEPLNASDIILDPVEELRAKKLHLSTTNLTVWLESKLTTLSKDQLTSYEAVVSAGMTRLEFEKAVESIVTIPPELVEVASVFPGLPTHVLDNPYIAVLTSSSFSYDSDDFRWDYQINGHSATKYHKDVLKLGGELNIRSFKSKCAGMEGTVFYAKAFQLKSGDVIKGYLNVNGDKEPPCKVCYVVKNGQLVNIPVSKIA